MDRIENWEQHEAARFTRFCERNKKAQTKGRPMREDIVYETVGDIEALFDRLDGDDFAAFHASLVSVIDQAMK